MKALQATCILGAITFTGMIHQVGENTPGATVPDAMPEAAMSAETPGGPAFSAAVPEASAAGSGPSLMPQAEIGDDTFEAKWMALGHHDAAQPMPTTHEASDGASNPAPVTQDFRYLIYYVWSELPPAEKPAAIVLSSLKDTPVGTPVEEIKRASRFGRCFRHGGGKRRRTGRLGAHSRFRHCVRHGCAWRVSANQIDHPRDCYGTHDAGSLQGFHCPQLRGTVPERTLHVFPVVQGESAT